MKLRAISGFDAKGPACFLLEDGGTRLLLDLGKGPDGGRRPDLSGVGRVDAVLISHGHADHVGSLDLLEAVGNPPVYATAPVRALAEEPALKAALDLLREGSIAGLPVETGPAGHAPGAVWMRIGGPEGLVYSGDYSPDTAVFACSPLPAAAVAVVDCSYGAAGEKTGREALLAAIGGGPALLPAPPAGRALDIALACLDAALEVRLCRDTRRVAEVLIGQPEWTRPGLEDALRRLLDRAPLLGADAPLAGVMIAGGANAGSGLSQALAPRAFDQDVPVIFTGHLSQGSPAVAWVADGRARRIRWNVHPDGETLAALLDEAQPSRALAAFCDREARLAVANAFPRIDWSTNGTLQW